MKVVYIRVSNIYDDSRATKEIMALAANGYEVVVYGWNRAGDAAEKCAQAFRGKKKICFRFFNVYAAEGIGIKNINKLVKWFFWCLRQLMKEKNIKLVHACDLDAAIPAWIFRSFTRKLLIYDIYDYYVDAHEMPNLLAKLVERLDRHIIHQAALVVICTEERKHQLNRAKPKRLIVVHNSPELFKGLEQQTIRYDYAYCGTLCEKRLIGEILDRYPEHEDLRFAFAGGGVYAKKAKALAERYPNFSYFGTVSYQQVLEIEMQSKIISAIYQPKIRNHRFCAPNKFYEAMALSKPVIVCKGTGIDQVVDDQKIGVSISFDAEAFYQTVRRLSEKEGMRRTMGDNGHALYEKKYRWDKMAKVLVDAYRKL